MGRHIVGLIWCAALLLASPSFAQELRGVALVIGEADYSRLPKLANPENDARAMDDLLDSLGFDVTRVLDADGDKLKERIARFIEDAADADVALVYYSGHGFEAGGDNYLVPIDADLGSPKAAGASVIGVAALLDELARTVPVTIVLLDACRTNVFPAGFAIQPPGAGAPLPITEGGLAETRGPTPIGQPGVPADNLGMVIGFAASPGQPALDGASGEANSPYAAALLKHLAAGGYSFGDLMTLVTEEVYLKTKARQLPWVNSSLRRVLTFGVPVENPDADETAIRTGRRSLLLSIASAPDQTRKYVETVAANEGVPLDALFGMLKVLGVDTTDPGEIERKVAEGTARLKAMLDAAIPMVADDPEIAHLSDLAERAETEGAIAEALDFRNRASTRASLLSTALDNSQGQIDTQRLSLAATFARNGDTALLAFDYAIAAERFGQAFDEAKEADLATALGYLKTKGDALQSLGEFSGDNPTLLRAIDTYQSGLNLADKIADIYGDLQNGMGRALRVLGSRESDPAHLNLAIDTLNAALEIRTRAHAPFAWAETQTNLGGALIQLGSREADDTHLKQAIAAFRAALEVRTRETTPQDWALTMNNLGATLQRLGERGDSKLLAESIDTYRAALEIRTRDASPYYWASTQHNLGSVLSYLGRTTADAPRVNEALAAFDAALLEWTRERAPLDWAQVQTSVGTAQQWLGANGGGLEPLHAAEAAERSALEIYSEAATPLDWAYVSDDLGWTLRFIGEFTGSRDTLEDALMLMNRAWKAYSASGQNLDSYFQPRIDTIQRLLG
ncbi:MAG: caspase family protein [Devosia sp.]